jgi:hypothetical protein
MTLPYHALRVAESMAWAGYPLPCITALPTGSAKVARVSARHRVHAPHANKKGAKRHNLKVGKLLVAHTF